MKTPKQQFLEHKDVARRHLERSDDPEFQHVLTIALAQYTQSLFGGPSAVNDAKRIGAQEFVEILCNLSVPREIPRGAPPGQLIDPDFHPTAQKPTPYA